MPDGRIGTTADLQELAVSFRFLYPHTDERGTGIISLHAPRLANRYGFSYLYLCHQTAAEQKRLIKQHLGTRSNNPTLYVQMFRECHYAAIYQFDRAADIVVVNKFPFDHEEVEALSPLDRDRLRHGDSRMSLSEPRDEAEVAALNVQDCYRKLTPVGIDRLVVELRSIYNALFERACQEMFESL